MKTSLLHEKCKIQNLENLLQLKTKFPRNKDKEMDNMAQEEFLEFLLSDRK